MIRYTCSIKYVTILLKHDDVGQMISVWQGRGNKSRISRSCAFHLITCDQRESQKQIRWCLLLCCRSDTTVAVMLSPRLCPGASRGIIWCSISYLSSRTDIGASYRITAIVTLIGWITCVVLITGSSLPILF